MQQQHTDNKVIHTKNTRTRQRQDSTGQQKQQQKSNDKKTPKLPQILG